MSSTNLSVVLVAVAALFYGGFVLYGAWIDGRRQAVREKGMHPTTEDPGEVHARQQEDQDQERHDHGR